MSSGNNAVHVRRRLAKVLSEDEMRELVRPSDLQGALAILGDWAMIFAALALAGLWPNALTVSLALVIVGGRQLGFAILMHEASHRTLFRTRWLNDVVGRWLCAAPVQLDLPRYRKLHLAHHAFTGTDRDPDLCLVEPFPVTPGALARKLARDLTGVSGLKRVLATLAMDLELITYTTSGGALPIARREPGWALRAAARIGPFVMVNAALLVGLCALGQGWLYAIWIGAFLTTYSAFVRIRSIAEHACTERSDDPFRNTRTTEAGFLARMLVAPHSVHHHLEHHLLITVPFFRLARFHEMLKSRGALEHAEVEPGYLAVLRRATGQA